MSYPISPVEEFLPGDQVEVIAGTFAGMRGPVVSLADARSLWKRAGGEQPPSKASPNMVFVVLPIFGRSIPVCLLEFQLRRLAKQ
jgi:transcription antitermination factor NusG